MKRWQIVALATLAVAVVAIIAGYRLGVELLRDRVVAALGPGARLAELKVNWFSPGRLGRRGALAPLVHRLVGRR